MHQTDGRCTCGRLTCTAGLVKKDEACVHDHRCPVCQTRKALSRGRGSVSVPPNPDGAPHGDARRPGGPSAVSSTYVKADAVPDTHPKGMRCRSHCGVLRGSRGSTASTSRPRAAAALCLRLRRSAEAERSVTAPRTPCSWPRGVPVSLWTVPPPAAPRSPFPFECLPRAPRGVRVVTVPTTTSCSDLPSGLSYGRQLSATGAQRCGSRSSMCRAGCRCTRSSTSVRYARALIPCFSHEATSV